MFVYNVKLNKKLFSKIIILIMCILVIGIFAFAAYLVFSKAISESRLNDSIPISERADINNNYTNILKMVHDDLDTYIGRKISCIGYVYRVSDLAENNFIIARNMSINSNNDTVVVGFLCDYENAKNLENDTWVKIEGTIEKGNYFGEIPIIKITNLEKTQEPEDSVVTMPDENFIPTSNIY